MENDYWSTGWRTHIYTLPNGDDYLLRYMSNSQNLRLTPLTSGYFGVDIYNGTWGADYNLFHSVQKDAHTYVVALDEYGVLESFQVQNNGLLVASDTVTTGLSDWSSMHGYNIEGTAIVHLYRASDGFFTLYEIDSNGFWAGPLATGFEEMGWSAMTFSNYALRLFLKAFVCEGSPPWLRVMRLSRCLSKVLALCGLNE